jgi:F-type H+-transporting ATPase subunit beta
VLVDIKDTIKGFNMIIDGELDHLPESAFTLKVLLKMHRSWRKKWQKLNKVS